MKIDNLIYLCVDDNVHAKAHLSRMLDIEALPCHVYVLTPNLFKTLIRKWFSIGLKIYRSIKGVDQPNDADRAYSKKIFGRDITDCSIFFLLRAARIKTSIVRAANVNDQSVYELLQSDTSTYVLSNAHGIVGKRLLDMGKTWINCHKGYLPDFRGSSATYWSTLTGGTFGATVHFMDQGIDTGPILEQQLFQSTKVQSRRQWKLFEAHMVSSTLAKVLSRWKLEGPPSGREQDRLDGKTYFLMHHVLANIVSSDFIMDENFEIQNTEYKTGILDAIESLGRLGEGENFEEIVEDVLWEVKQEASPTFKSNLRSILKDITGSGINGIWSAATENWHFVLLMQKTIDLGWSKGKIRNNSSLSKWSSKEIILSHYLLMAIVATTKDMTILNTALKLGDILIKVDFTIAPTQLRQIGFRSLTLQMKTVRQVEVQFLNISNTVTKNKCPGVTT